MENVKSNKKNLVPTPALFLLTISIIIAIVTLAILAFRITNNLQIANQLIATTYPILLSIVILSWVEKRSRKAFLITSIFITLYYLLDAFLLLYRMDRKFTFDFYFLWYNLSDAVETVIALAGDPITMGIAAAITVGGAYAIYRTITVCVFYFTAWQPLKPIKKAITIIVFIASISLFINNEILNLVMQFNPNNQEVLKIYYQNYNQSIAKNKSNKTSTKKTTSDNIFMIHLESINAELVTDKITPNLINTTSENGIFIPRIQSSTMLTIRSQEVLLCGILPSVGANLSKTQVLTKDLHCLPRILKENGYKTMFFQSYADFNFANTGNFMKNIGFDEIHSKDIMEDSDLSLNWGYPEDIFYTRVFEYLKKHQNEKIFAYIAVSSTNHYPFYNEEKENFYPQFKNQIPYNKPKTIKDVVANTTYIQDNFFGYMYTKLFEPNYRQNSDLYVFGDHSWPIEIHPGNKFNENGAYQENFVSSFGIIPALNKAPNFKTKKIMTNLHSHLDIPLTILDITGITGYHLSGHSFINEILAAPDSAPQTHCLVSVQPFTNKYVTTIRYPQKNIYNIKKNTITTYNIQDDPYEKNPLSEKAIANKDLDSLKACLQENNV